MLTGYITFVDMSFSGFRIAHLASLSYGLVKMEYRSMATRPLRVERMANNYPDIRLNTSGNHVVMH